MSEPCGCYMQDGKLAHECEFHKRREKLIISRTVLYLESKIRMLFSSTHLREMEDKVITVVRKMRNASKSEATNEKQKT